MSRANRYNTPEFNEGVERLLREYDKDRHKDVARLRLMLAEVASVIPLVANDPEGEINRLVNLFEPIKSLLKETR